MLRFDQHFLTLRIVLEDDEIPRDDGEKMGWFTHFYAEYSHRVGDGSYFTALVGEDSDDTVFFDPEYSHTLDVEELHTVIAIVKAVVKLNEKSITFECRDENDAHHFAAEFINLISLAGCPPWWTFELKFADNRELSKL